MNLFPDFYDITFEKAWVSMCCSVIIGCIGICVIRHFQDLELESVFFFLDKIFFVALYGEKNPLVWKYQGGGTLLVNSFWIVVMEFSLSFCFL